MSHRKNTHDVGAAVGGALTLSAVAACLAVFTAGWETTAASLQFGLLLWVVLFPLAALVLLLLDPADGEPPAQRVPTRPLLPHQDAHRR